MRKLYEEICVRFPEVLDKVFPGDDELPFVMMSRVCEWLTGLPDPASSPEVISRVRAFTVWCEEQPPGETAGEDILTILMVGFYEKLLEKDRLRLLLPTLLSKETLTQNAQYFRTWAGDDCFAEALKVYP